MILRLGAVAIVMTAGAGVLTLLDNRYDFSPEVFFLGTTAVLLVSGGLATWLGLMDDRAKHRGRS